MQDRKVVVAGSRDGISRDQVRDAMRLAWRTWGGWGTTIEGGARGVDGFAAGISKEGGLVVETYKAQWDKFGKSAGYKRNVRMAQEATHLLAIWDGTSKGTKHMIDIARGMGLMVMVVEPSKDETKKSYTRAGA